MKRYPKYETCDLMHNGVCVSKPCICKGMSMSKKRKEQDELKYVKSMPTPKEAELWPPPSKSMTDENVNKLKEGIRMLNDLQTKLAVANGTILDKDIQIKQLEAERSELQTILTILQPWISGVGWIQHEGHFFDMKERILNSLKTK